MILLGGLRTPGFLPEIRRQLGMRKQWTSDCQVVIHVNLEASLQLQTENVGSVLTLLGF